MNFAKLMACTGLMALSGCSVLEGLGRGLAGLSDIIEEGEVVYMANSTSSGLENFHYIDRVLVFRGREGRAPGVEVEAEQRRWVRITEAEFPTDDINGTGFSINLRNDGTRMQVFLPESVPDTLEGHAIVLSVPEGRRMMSVTDEVIARAAYELCFDPARFLPEFNDFLEDEGLDPENPPDVTWEFFWSGGVFQQWEIKPRGFTPSGDVVWEVVINYRALSQEFDPVFFANQLDGLSELVVFSADTGEPVSCFDGVFEEAYPRPYSFFQNRAGDPIVLSIPDAPTAEMFRFPSQTPAVQFRITGTMWDSDAAP